MYVYVYMSMCICVFLIYSVQYVGKFAEQLSIGYIVLNHNIIYYNHLTYPTIFHPPLPQMKIRKTKKKLFLSFFWDFRCGSAREM